VEASPGTSPRRCSPASYSFFVSTPHLTLAFRYLCARSRHIWCRSKLVSEIIPLRDSRCNWHTKFLASKLPPVTFVGCSKIDYILRRIEVLSSCKLQFTAQRVTLNGNWGSNLGCSNDTLCCPTITQPSKPAFPKLWSADHRWSPGSALVVLLDWTLVKKRQKK
jgi:hypothetical protein